MQAFSSENGFKLKYACLEMEEFKKDNELVN